MAILNPLTEAHCRDIDQVLQNYPHLKETYEALQACGLDCKDRLETLEAQYEICTNFKRKFNPLAS